MPLGTALREGLVACPVHIYSSTIDAVLPTLNPAAPILGLQMPLFHLHLWCVERLPIHAA